MEAILMTIRGEACLGIVVMTLRGETRKRKSVDEISDTPFAKFTAKGKVYPMI